MKGVLDEFSVFTRFRNNIVIKDVASVMSRCL